VIARALFILHSTVLLLVLHNDIEPSLLMNSKRAMRGIECALKTMGVWENMEFKGGNDPMQKLMLQVMGAFAEFERSMIRERQREGIQAAKKAGKQIGAKPKLTPEQVAQIKTRISAGEYITSLAEEFGVSRQTIYNSV